MPGYVRNRAELARWLASADIYVSGMADETFGISIIEAQASGLPVVGVAAGAMIDRVTDAMGRLGPVGDADAMAANILAVWNGDGQAWRPRRAPMRFSSAGTAAWKRCSAGSIRPPSSAANARSAARRAGTRGRWPEPRGMRRRRMEAPYAKLEQLEPGIAGSSRITRPPSPITARRPIWSASNEVAVIDPGPDLPEHLDALERAIGGRPVVAIMCTHTHRDHSPAARPLAERTGAPIVGCAPLALETVGPRADASFDGDYRAGSGARRMASRSRSTARRSRPSRRRATPPTICASPIAARCSAAIM